VIEDLQLGPFDDDSRNGGRADYGHYGGAIHWMAWKPRKARTRIGDGPAVGRQETARQRFAGQTAGRTRQASKRTAPVLWPIKQKYGRKNYPGWRPYDTRGQSRHRSRWELQDVRFCAAGREDVWEPDESITGARKAAGLSDERYTSDAIFRILSPLLQMGLISR